VGSAATPRKKQEGELVLKERWYPIQVKQKDKVGRPDIDAFEAMMMREDCGNCSEHAPLSIRVHGMVTAPLFDVSGV
jgi:hypothetical protein